MSGFPVESLSKFIPEYQAIRPMEGGDDLEIEIALPLKGDETYESLYDSFQQWKDGLDLYVQDDGKKGKGQKGAGTQRGGLFSIASQLLAYPVEKKSSAENVEFISMLKQQAAELL